MSNKIRLSIHKGNLDNQSILVPAKTPVILGDFIGDTTLICDHCEALIADNVHPKQILNLLIVCPNCSRSLATSTLQPGSPISGKYVSLQPGKYMLSDSIDAKKVVCAGTTATTQYEKEVGIIGGSEPKTWTVTSDSIQSLAQALADSLGENYTRFRSAYERKISTGGSPATLHRIIDMVAKLEALAEELTLNSTSMHSIDGNLLAEAITAEALISRWSNHSILGHIQNSLKDPVEVRHTIMLLAVASFFTDASNGVGLVTTSSLGRVSDIWIEPSLWKKVAIEIKTPLALREPTNPHVSRSEARRLITSILSSAASDSHGQLRNSDGGIVVIGGFHMGSSYKSMYKEARQILRSDRKRWSNLIGVLICDLTYATTNGNQGSDALTPLIRKELVHYAGYKGEVTIYET
jgi:hypothetical protein